jgi:hypothetical protein
MQDEIGRELNKAQAGGWMSRIDDEDERVAAVMKGLDKTIEECDELDGLLTLYNVELSVSYSPPTQLTPVSDCPRPSTKILPTSKHNLKACKSKQPIRSYFTQS